MAASAAAQGSILALTGVRTRRPTARGRLRARGRRQAPAGGGGAPTYAGRRRMSEGNE